VVSAPAAMESVVQLTSRAGEAELYVFQWWLKPLRRLGVRTRLRSRIATGRTWRCHVLMRDSLPPITEGVRKLPRLRKPRYSTLHQYLKAHLPELKDVGRDFPSPERFDGYTWKCSKGTSWAADACSCSPVWARGGCTCFGSRVKDFRRPSTFPAIRSPIRSYERRGRRSSYSCPRSRQRSDSSTCGGDRRPRVPVAHAPLWLRRRTAGQLLAYQAYCMWDGSTRRTSAS
jgi:hypothetical protein